MTLRFFATPAMPDLPIAALPATVRGKEHKARKFDCNSPKLPMAALPAPPPPRGCGGVKAGGGGGVWAGEGGREQGKTNLSHDGQIPAHVPYCTLALAA